jgi:PadR family transcriptional regulator, regulatory protein AphA
MAVSRPEAVPPELSPTGRVILGMLAAGTRTGYDIKQIVDRSTRHFWAASYGQIYPELKRLESAGLVVSRSEPTGGRARQVYEPTEAGRAALENWLDSGGEPLYELRDEGMLKLFFSDFTSPRQRLANLHAMRERAERKLAALRELEGKGGSPGPGLTLRLGIAITQCYADACSDIERQLTTEPEEH